MDFCIKSCLCIWSMLWLIHIIFPNFSTELWPLIDFRIMFMLNILWNNLWIWSHWYFFYAKTCATTKICTVAGYHVELAMLFYLIISHKTLDFQVWLSFWMPQYNKYEENGMSKSPTFMWFHGSTALFTCRTEICASKIVWGTLVFSYIPNK